MITGLDHIAIAVPDLDAAIARWESVTGGKIVHRETVRSQKVEVAMIRIGDLRIELVMPTSPDSPVAKYIDRRGPGIHHIALAASSTCDELARLQETEVPLIDTTARPGAHGSRVGFVHPRALEGVLIEIVDHPGEESDGSPA